MYQNMVKSGLISGGHIRPGPDMAARYENMDGFRPQPDMISGATLPWTRQTKWICDFQSLNILNFENFTGTDTKSHVMRRKAGGAV